MGRPLIWLGFLLVMLVGLSRPARGDEGGAQDPWYWAAAAQEDWTDNAKLSARHPVNDRITELDLWLRYRFYHSPQIATRLVLDVKDFSYARHSFDDYTYSAVGVDYQRRLHRGRSIEAEYAHLTNGSYDSEAPFHLFEGDRLQVAYSLRPWRTDTLTWAYRHTTRQWDFAARDRNGHNDRFSAEYTHLLCRGLTADLELAYDKESTVVPFANEFARHSARLSLHQSRGKQTALDVSGRVYDRDYVGPREDMHRALAVGLSRQVARDTSVEVGYERIEHHSTIARRAYDEHIIGLQLRRRFR